MSDEITRLRAEVDLLMRERDAFQTRIKKEACSIANARWKARADAAERKAEKLREALENILQNARCTNQSVVAVVNLSWLVEARAILAGTETNNEN